MKMSRRLLALFTALVICLTAFPLTALASYDTASAHVNSVPAPEFSYTGEYAQYGQIAVGDPFDLTLGWTTYTGDEPQPVGEIREITLVAAGNPSQFYVLYKNGKAFYGATASVNGNNAVLRGVDSSEIRPGAYFTYVTAEDAGGVNTMQSSSLQAFSAKSSQDPGGPGTGEPDFPIEPYFFKDGELNESVTSIPIGSEFAISVYAGPPEDVLLIELFSEGETFREYVLYEDGQVFYGGRIDNESEGPSFMTGFSSAEFEPGDYYLKIATKSWADGTHEPAVTFTGTGSVKEGPAVAPVADQSAAEGEVFSLKLQATPRYGGVITWSLTSGSLPAGLKLDAKTGVISGTPTTQGLYPITVKASEAGGGVRTVSFTLNVKGIPRYQVSFDLQNGKPASGADYNTKQTKQSEKILLPAAPSKSGYRFVYWKNGDNYYLPGAEVTVNADLRFTAEYTVREPLKVTLPKEFDAAIGLWLVGTDVNGAEYWLWTQRRDGKPNVSIPAPSLIDRTFEKLELYGVVDNKTAVLASYTGEVTAETASVALVSTGVQWQLLKGVAIKGLTQGVDFEVYSLISDHMAGSRLWTPCLVTKGSEFSAGLSAIWDSEAAQAYDLTAEYVSKNVKDGFLVIEPIRLSDSAAVTLNVELDGSSYWGTVLASQTVNGVTRTVSGSYYGANHETTLHLYPGKETVFSLCFYNESYVFEGQTLAAPKNGDTHTVKARTVTLNAEIQLETDAAPELANRYVRAVNGAYYRLLATQTTGGSEAVQKSYGNSPDAETLTLRTTLPMGRIKADAACRVDYSSGYAFDATAQAKLSGGEGSVKLKTKLRPGVVAQLSAESTAHVFLCWFDSAGKYLGGGDDLYLASSGATRDAASVCPAGKAGSYTVALMPFFWTDTAFLQGKTLSELQAEGQIIKSWPVKLTATGVQELEPYCADAVTSENATFATKPYSSLNADIKSFSSVSDVLRFSGSIGLDPGLENGKLHRLFLNHRGNNEAILFNAAIGGKTYKPTRYDTSSGSAEFEFTEPVELPCTFTFYASPLSTQKDVSIIATAEVSFSGDHRLYQQRIGEASVSRPGASVSTFSTYVCDETAVLNGTALPNEAVKIYDNGVLVAEAKASWTGDWTAAAPLSGIDETYTTAHSIYAETASGVRSNAVTVLHRKNGPQLKALNLIMGNYEWTGSVFSSNSMYYHDKVQFRLIFEHPDQLEPMDEWNGAKAAVKAYMGSGDVRFIPAVQQPDGSFIADAGPSGYSFYQGVEAIYRPKAGPEDFMENDDGSMTCLPTAEETKENAALLAALREYLTADETGRIVFTGLTEKQSLAVKFDDAGKAEVSGGLYSGAAKDQRSKLTKGFGDVSKAFSEEGLRLTEITSGIRDGMNLLEWLDAQSDAKIAANRKAGDKATAAISQRTQIFSSAAAYENTKKLISRYAVDPAYSDFAAGKNHTLFRYGKHNTSDLYTISDCVYDDNGELVSGSYSVNVMLTADTGGSPAVYTASVTATFSPAFKGYAGLKAPGGAKKSGGALSLLAVTAYASQVDTSAFRMSYDGKFADEPAYEASSSAESFSAELSNWTGGVGGFIGTGSNLSGLMGGFSNGLGFISTGAAVYNLKKTYDNGSYRIGTRLKMQWDLENLVSSTCYKRLTRSKRQLVDEAINKFKKAQKKEEDVDGWYTGLGLGINVGSAICNTVASGMGEFGAEWAAAGLGVTGLGVINGATLGRAMNKARSKTIRQYEESYKTIKSIFQSHANQTGLDDCKHLKKDESNGKSYTVIHDPSGVVYEGVIENPVPDAKVTLWYGVDANGRTVLEKDAKNVKKVVPAYEVNLIPEEAVQITGADGKYAWFVPQGLWYVTAEKTGLSGSSNADKAAVVKVSGVKAGGKTITNLLPVLPEQLDVNIPLVDKTAPYVESVLYTDEGIYITFSKYMVDTAKDADSVLNAANYTLKTAAGSVAVAGVKAVEQGHTPANIDGKNVKTYTRTVLLVPKTALKAGTQVLITVKKGVKSYAGSAMAADYADSGTVAAQKSLASPVIAGGAKQTLSYGAAITISLPKGAPEGTKIYYTTDGSVPTADGKLYKGPLSATNKMTIRAAAVCAGYQDSPAASAEIHISEAQQYNLAGSVRASKDTAGLKVTLTGGDYKKTATVDANGCYAFELVPVGSYTLSFAGNAEYRAASVKVEIDHFDPWVNLALTAKNETPDYTPGDVDFSGKIEAADARLALRRAVGLEDYPEGSAEYLACDVDGASGVSAADARLILRAAVGLEDASKWQKR